MKRASKSCIIKLEHPLQIRASPPKQRFYCLPEVALVFKWTVFVFLLQQASGVSQRALSAEYISPVLFNWRAFFALSLLFCFFIFLVGALGIIFNRKNIILLMVSVEIMFLGINLIFIFSFLIHGNPTALLYSLVILSLAAAEAAIGFGLLVASFRNKPTIEFKAFNRLKG